METRRSQNQTRHLKEKKKKNKPISPFLKMFKGPQALKPIYKMTPSKIIHANHMELIIDIEL